MKGSRLPKKPISSKLHARDSFSTLIKVSYPFIYANHTVRDIDKQGYIKQDAFFQLIKLQGGIDLRPEDQEHLKRKCRVTQAGAHDSIMYKEALKVLQPNLESNDPLSDKWCIR